MRISTLALAASAVAVFGWSGTGVVSAAPPRCADLGGVVDSTQTCQIQATDPGYSLNISYPVNYPDVQPVFDYVKQTRDGFLNVAKMPDGRATPYELDTTATQYSSDVPPRGTQSVVFKTYQGVGGAHPQTFYKSFNWDQGLHEPITIDNLFRESTAPFPVLFPLVQAEVDKQLSQPVTIAPGDGLDPTKYQNFAITNDSLIFFFSQGDLLPEAAGALQVTVPRGPVDAMIA
ncbi:MAG: esterase [Mycobacterium sp.]